MRLNIGFEEEDFTAGWFSMDCRVLKSNMTEGNVKFTVNRVLRRINDEPGHR
jgi:hypothetical protein